MHIYRWDLDRTYLDTDIHSVRGMVRAALEPADRKRNVPGASALLRGLCEWDGACRVSILSGSPTQMRAVLEEKLAIDGIRFDSLTLKDNLDNLRRGRLRALRGQVGYKLPRLLAGRVGLGPSVRESLFGDDAEVDALIYTLYADAIAGRLGEDDLARVMEAGGAYGDAVQTAVRTLRQISPADAVDDVFIHVDRGIPLQEFRLLGKRVVPVFSWLQAAVVLWSRGRLGTGGVVEVARAVMEDQGLEERAVASLYQDLVRRHHVSREDVERLLREATGLEPIAETVARALDRLGPLPPAPVVPDVPDYLAFLRIATS